MYYDQTKTLCHSMYVAFPDITIKIQCELRVFVNLSQGFPVAVSTTEEFKSKTLFEGTLIERNAEHVTISMKGALFTNHSLD